MYYIYILITVTVASNYLWGLGPGKAIAAVRRGGYITAPPHSTEKKTRKGSLLELTHSPACV